MDKQILVVLGLAAVGVAAAFYLTLMQLRRRRGDDLHQRRGVKILFVLLLTLLVLDFGLHKTSFRPEVISFSIHMVFAIPTAAILFAIAITGFRAKKGLAGAARLHRLLNKPAGVGAVLWLSASIVTGLVFVAISLARAPGILPVSLR